MNANPTRAVATLFSASSDRLYRLAEANGLGERASSIVALYERLLDPWGHRPASDRPSWPSYVGDDQTPVEFSATFSDKPELRILLEPLGQNPSLASNRDAALSLLDSLAKDYAMDLRRFERVRDLFCPPEPSGIFSVWLAVAFSGESPPDFKVYLNPRAQGRGLAPALVEEALVRLGFSGAWPIVNDHLLRRGPELDELNYLSLDLSASSDARLKVYARHSSCTPADLERAASVATSHRPGEVADFLRIVAPHVEGVFEGRAPSTCYTFVGRHGDQPVAATTHFPINSYAPDDGAITKRVLDAFARFGTPRDPYVRSVAAFARRPLDRGIGMHSYVSFRRYRDEARFTTYLAVEAYKPGTVESAGATAVESGVIEAAARVDRKDRLKDHPFCRRLVRDAVDPRQLLWVLTSIETAYRDEGVTSCDGPTEGPSGDTVREARASCDAVARKAGRLITRLSGTTVQRPYPADSENFEPGVRQKSRLVAIWGESDPLEVASAAKLASCFGQGLVDIIARLLGSTGYAKAEHAAEEDNDAQVDELVSSQALAAAWKGGREATSATFQFLDDLYAVCYGSRNARGRDAA